MPLREREELMGQLKESICLSLRASDIYTQYNSQFLAMVPGAGHEHMGLIESRIQAAFRERAANRTELPIRYNICPLRQIQL